MKHIFLNLKRFDVPVELGGVNRLAPMQDWGTAIVAGTQDGLAKYDPAEVEFAMYLPEAHVLNAVKAKKPGSAVKIGTQGVYRMDTAVGGNFGAFTTNRSASAVQAMGCESVLIGHCEERNDKMGILAEAGVTGKAATEAVNRILNQEIKCAIARGLSVLYCIGEKSEEQEAWQEVLGAQLSIGLDGLMGDVNNSGKINIVDAQVTYDMACGKYLAGSDAAAALLACWGPGATLPMVEVIANVNGDDAVDGTDAFAIQRYVHYGKFGE